MSAHWKRTLLFTAMAQSLSIMGFSFVVPFLPLFIQQLGIHGVADVTLWAAMLAGATAIGMGIAAPIWGVLADRYGRKIMVVRAAFSAALLIGLMGLAQSVWHLLFLRLLQGVFTGTVSASQALVASQSPRERMGFTLGVMQTAVFLGTSLGPVTGGLVAEAVGYRLTFGVAGALLFFGALMVMLFVREERIHVEEAVSVAGIFRGMGDALRAPALRPTIGAIFAVQFGVTIVFPILPQFIQYLQGPAGHAALATGLVFTGAGIAAAISSTAVGWLADRVGYKSVLVWSALIGAVVSVPQYFVNATWQIFVLRVAIGFALGAMMTSASALIATLVPREKRGTAYGLSGSATALGFAAGPLTAAAVVAVSGMRAVFLIAAILLAFIAAWVGSMVHVSRREEELVPVPALAGVELPQPDGLPDQARQGELVASQERD